MRILSLFITAVLSLPAFAQWQLVNEQSQLNFISTKKSKIAEVHSFKKLSGQVSSQGDIDLVIDLASVETNIPIRNERMQKYLFKTAQFPSAKFTAKVDAQALTALKAGQEKSISLVGALTLNGKTQEITSQVLVVKKAANELVVVTEAPIIINAADFALTQGIEKLKDLAKLPSISIAVPVTFKLSFK